MRASVTTNLQYKLLRAISQRKLQIKRSKCDALAQITTRTYRAYASRMRYICVLTASDTLKFACVRDAYRNNLISMRVACVTLQSNVKRRLRQSAYRQFTAAGDTLRRAIFTCCARKRFIEAYVKHMQSPSETIEENKMPQEARNSDGDARLRYECSKSDEDELGSEYLLNGGGDETVWPRGISIMDGECSLEQHVLRARCHEQAYQSNEASHEACHQSNEAGRSTASDASRNDCGVHEARGGEGGLFNDGACEKRTDESGGDGRIAGGHAWTDRGEGEPLSGRNLGGAVDGNGAGHTAVEHKPPDSCGLRSARKEVQETVPGSAIHVLHCGDSTPRETCAVLAQLLRRTSSQEWREIQMNSAVRVLQGTCRRVQAFIDMWVRVWAARIMAHAWMGHAARRTMRLLREMNDAKNVEKRLRDRGRKREAGGKLAGVAAGVSGTIMDVADSHVGGAARGEWGAECVNGGGEMVIGWRESVVEAMAQLGECIHHQNHSAVDAHAHSRRRSSSPPSRNVAMMPPECSHHSYSAVDNHAPWGSPRRKFIVSADTRGTCDGEKAMALNGVNHVSAMGGVGGVSARALNATEVVRGEAQQAGAEMIEYARQDAMSHEYEDGKVHMYVPSAKLAVASRGWQDASHVRRRINQFNGIVAWPPSDKTETYAPAVAHTHVTHAPTHTQPPSTQPQRSSINEPSHVRPHSPLAASSSRTDKQYASTMGTYAKSHATSHYYAPAERTTAKYKLASYYTPSYANGDDLGLSRRRSSLTSRPSHSPHGVPPFATSSVSETNTPRIRRPKTSPSPELRLSVRAGGHRDRDAKPSPRYGQGLDVWALLMQDDGCGVGVHDDADLDMAGMSRTDGGFCGGYVSRGLPREVRSQAASKTSHMHVERAHKQGHAKVKGVPLAASARDDTQYSHLFRDSDSSHTRNRTDRKSGGDVPTGAQELLRATALRRPATAGDGSRSNHAGLQVKRGSPHAHRITSRR
jgi:hypothetical protein